MFRDFCRSILCSYLWPQTVPNLLSFVCKQMWRLSPAICHQCGDRHWKLFGALAQQSILIDLLLILVHIFKFSMIYDTFCTNIAMTNTCWSTGSNIITKLALIKLTDPCINRESFEKYLQIHIWIVYSSLQIGSNRYNYVPISEDAIFVKGWRYWLAGSVCWCGRHIGKMCFWSLGESQKTR